MIRQHYRILLITLGIFLLTIPGLGACYRAAPTTPTTEPAPAITEEKAAPPEEKVVTEEKPTPTLIPTPVTIDISGFAFVAAAVTVPAGTTVTWTNKDSVAHTVSSRDDVFESGNLSSGATFSYTFSQSGTFQYYCRIHPSMTAKVIVGQEGTAPSEEAPPGQDDYSY